MTVSVSGFRWNTTDAARLSFNSLGCRMDKTPWSYLYAYSPGFEPSCDQIFSAIFFLYFVHFKFLILLMTSVEIIFYLLQLIPRVCNCLSALFLCLSNLPALWRSRRRRELCGCFHLSMTVLLLLPPSTSFKPLLSVIQIHAWLATDQHALIGKEKTTHCVDIRLYNKITNKIYCITK